MHEDPKLHVFIRRALRLREVYMQDAFQNFPEMTKRALHKSYKSNFTVEPGMLSANTISNGAIRTVIILLFPPSCQL